MVGIRIGGGGGFDPRPSRDGTAQLPNGCAGAQAHGCRASRQVTGVVAFVASLFFFAAAFDDEGPCPSYHISFCSPVFYPLIAPLPAMALRSVGGSEGASDGSFADRGS